MKRYSQSTFFESTIFGIQGKVNCLLFVSVVNVIIVVDTTCLLFKAINYILECFSFMSIFAKYISQIFYFRPQTFFRTDFGSSRKKSFEYAGNCIRGYTIMWLNQFVSLSWFAINIKFISHIVIFCFYLPKV